MGGWYSPPELAADAQNTGVLVAADPGLTPAPVASYSVSADPATVLAQSGGLLNCENENDLAVVPGGSEFILACGAPYAEYRYSTSDLSQQGSYAANPYPVAVAIDSGGDVAVGVQGNQTEQDLFIYQQGGDTPLNSYNLAGNGWLSRARRPGVVTGRLQAVRSRPKWPRRRCWLLPGCHRLPDAHGVLSHPDRPVGGQRHAEHRAVGKPHYRRSRSSDRHRGNDHAVGRGQHCRSEVRCHH